MSFIPRAEKASWGFPCNQKSDGSIWAGKGYECPLEEQIGDKVAAAVTKALAGARGGRNGRFWINLATREITMAVGDSADNEYDTISY